MREFRGKVAVVTGAASGIGREMARQFAAEGMKVVLADIEQAPLEQVADEMRQSGATIIREQVNVSKRDDLERLATRAYDEFGAVHLLCNNA
ncbi:MAG: SDR family NAD(P)-dependent oxidoreductase, partial [Acidobacteriaceae bacterium]|nr:SDR family NAD(P)-dependent oxidoreductase [Acidobacteriaceae bacterium]